MVGVAGVIYRRLEKVLGVVVVVWRKCLGLFGGFVEAVFLFLLADGGLVTI